LRFLEKFEWTNNPTELCDFYIMFQQYPQYRGNQCGELIGIVARS